MTINQIREHPWMAKHDFKPIDEGIIIGFNKIPIDGEVLGQLRYLNLDIDHVVKCLEANRHNNATTSYYLSLKKYLAEGGQPSYDLTSKSTDKSML